MATDTMPDPQYGPAEIAPNPIEETGAISDTPKPKRKYTRRDPNAPARPRGRPRGKRSLENDIGGMLLMSNFVFGFMPEPWSGDAFTEEEIKALSQALDAFAQEHATVYKYLSSILIGGSSSTINLVIVLGSLANRRLANHGVTMAQLLGISQPQSQKYSEWAAEQEAPTG